MDNEAMTIKYLLKYIDNHLKSGTINDDTPVYLCREEGKDIYYDPVTHVTVNLEHIFIIDTLCRTDKPHHILR